MIILIYILKLTACTALFYGYYFFFLRNKQLHRYNRFYILSGFALAVLLPLVKIPLALPGGQSSQTLLISLQGIHFGGWEDEIILTANQGFLASLVTLKHVLLFIYIGGLLVAIYPVVRSLVYLRSISRKHTRKTFGNIRFYDTAEAGTPFSFFNTVFWNKDIPVESENGRHIFMHEVYHIREKHSYDLLFMQCASAILWFNPFCYFMIRELKVIHEFLADEYAASLTDKHQYAELLVMQALAPKKIFISNPFFYNQIKRRITMILHKTNTGYANIRKAMALPFVLLMFCACSLKSKDESILQPAQNNADKVFTKVEVEASYPAGPNGWMRYLNKHFKYPQEAQDKESQGTVLVRFIVEEDGTITQVETIQGKKINEHEVRSNDNAATDESQNKEAISVIAKSSKWLPGKKINVNEVSSNTNYATDESLNKEAIRIIAESGKWLPAKQNGIIVRSYKIQPITFKLEAE